MKKATNGAFTAIHSKTQIPRAICPISAGDGNSVTDDYELLDINEYLTKGREGCISYRVNGESMVPFIPHGCSIVVDPYSEPKPGNIVAFCVNGEIMVKFMEVARTEIRLVSGNRKVTARRITGADNFNLLGVVVGQFMAH